MTRKINNTNIPVADKRRYKGVHAILYQLSYIFFTWILGPRNFCIDAGS